MGRMPRRHTELDRYKEKAIVLHRYHLTPRLQTLGRKAREALSCGYGYVYLPEAGVEGNSPISSTADKEL